VPACREHGLGILPWSPLAAGFLTGKYRRDQKPAEGTRLDQWGDRWGRFDTDRHWKILAAVDEVAEQTKASPSQVALAWLMHKPQVCSVIFGARTVKQLEDNAGAAKLELSAEQMSALDEASAFPLGYPYDFIGRVQKRW